MKLSVAKDNAKQGIFTQEVLERSIKTGIAMNIWKKALMDMNGPALPVQAMSPILAI